MLLVGIPFLWRAFQWQIPVRMATVPLALTLCLVSLVGVRVFKHQLVFAFVTTLAIYIAGLGAVISGGGVGSVGVGWLMLVPLLAGILWGMRGGLCWGVLVLISLYVLFVLQANGWDFSDQTPAQFQGSQQIIQAFGLTSAVLILMVSYMSQIGYSERVLVEQNQALLAQIERAELAEHETQKAVQAKTQFFANMSHELKTPLNSILGFARRLESASVDKLDRREQGALQMVLDYGQHMLSLVNDLLALSQMDANELKLRSNSANTEELMFRVIAEVAPVAEQFGLKLNSQVTPGVMVKCDGERLTQALTNLLRHCVKYAREGEIEIRTEVTESVNMRVQMRFASVCLGGEEVNRLFDRYNHLHSQIDRDVGCSALGLVVAAELIQLHGGEVWVEVKDNNEMQFLIKLPLA